MSDAIITDVREYYRRVTELDIGSIARDLLGDWIVQATSRLLQCDCPHHESQSHRSLHVMLDKQGWYCFGCGIGGDVLQLVEFVQTGIITAGQFGPMPESHRQARDYLAGKAGLPPLSQYGLSKDQIAEIERERETTDRVTGALTALTDYYHERLNAHPEVLDWIVSHYAISPDSIRELRIGYADNEADVVKRLTTGRDVFSREELIATGAFLRDRQGVLRPFFDRRVVFPYWHRSRVVYLSGRKTPWTPDRPWEKGKYKKLPVHDEHQRPQVSRCISNTVLFNEDCLLSRPSQTIITEGITDCIALMQQGFEAISPATIHIRNEDWTRLLPKLRVIGTVYLCHDNEVSRAGIEGALQTAKMLEQNEVRVKLVELPLDDRRTQARRTLRERYGIVDGKHTRKDVPSPDHHDVERLLADAKRDVNDYFREGYTAKDFEELLGTAVTVLEYAISSLPDNSEEERNRQLESILKQVSSMSPLEQDRYLKLIQKRCHSSGLTRAVLREQLKACQRTVTDNKPKMEHPSPEQLDSCREVVAHVLASSEGKPGTDDFSRAAESAFDWFTSHGALFFHTSQGEPFMFFEDAMLWMDSSDRGRKRVYASVMYKQTGMVQTTGGGRTFLEVLANLAIERGQVREHFSWLHTDIARYTIYFNLNNREHEIAKISPEGVEVFSNGGNPDGIILDGSRKMLPLHFIPDASDQVVDRLLEELILNNLTCSPGDRHLILAWMMCFLLLDFAGTRPMTRFEGPAGSGKTTASKLISALLFGESQQKKSTDAANYTDGYQNPLIVLVNIEVKQMTSELTTFLLTSITGIAKEKRKSGTDTETIIERTKCLLNTTGIEPLGGELSEILSRSFVIRFDLNEQASDCFLEAKILAAKKESRDVIVSALMMRTSRVLAMLRDGAQEKVMQLLHRALGSHSKRRCNDYLSLMYLMMIAGRTQKEITWALQELHPQYVERIASLNSVSSETARESNPIATCLASLFNAYRHALEADRESTAMNIVKSNKASFLERYQIEFMDETTIEGAYARDLFVALKRLAKDFGLTFGMTSVQQFSQRFTNDLDTIRQAGFDITVNRPEVRGHRTATYSIIRLD